MIRLNQIEPVLPYEFKNERELVDSINELVEIFNVKRDEISTYLENRRLASAYTLFFMTTNMPKLEAICELIPELEEDLRNSTFVDIGTGPGTFLLAYYEKFGIQKSAYGIEISSMMKNIAQVVLDEIHPGHNTEFLTGPRNLPKDSLLTFTNSFNEMGVEKALDYIDLYGRNKILLIEPGTKETFRKISKLRTELLERGYQIQYPCFSDSPCPWADNDDDWCHQFVRLSHEQCVERLCQLVKRDRHLQSLCLFYFVKKKKEVSNARIIRVLRAKKHAIDLELCIVKDGQNKVIHFESLKRNYSKKECRALNDLMSGSKLTIEIESELKNGIYRGLILNF